MFNAAVDAESSFYEAVYSAQYRLGIANEFACVQRPTRKKRHTVSVAERKGVIGWTDLHTAWSSRPFALLMGDRWSGFRRAGNIEKPESCPSSAGELVSVVSRWYRPHRIVDHAPILTAPAVVLDVLREAIAAVRVERAA